MYTYTSNVISRYHIPKVPSTPRYQMWSEPRFHGILGPSSFSKAEANFL